MTITTSDGQEIPVHRGEWVFWTPNGHPEGCCYAFPALGSDPNAAARYFWREEADTLLAAGYRAELMTRARWEAEVMPRMLTCARAKESSR